MDRMFYSLGEHQFSIGIWIGGDSTYNTNKQAHDDFKKILIRRKKSNINLNKFHISGCSWCGAKFQIKIELRLFHSHLKICPLKIFQNF